MSWCKGRDCMLKVIGILLLSSLVQAGGFQAFRQANQEDFLTGNLSGVDVSLSAGDIVVSKTESLSTLSVTLPR